MHPITSKILKPFPTHRAFNLGMLFLRVAASVEIAIVHGGKKLGIGTAVAETIPNPFHLPVALNDLFAISANIIFPFFVLLGFFTRLSTLPVLTVTLTGYFVVHHGDTLLQKDIPFMYSLVFLVIFIMGPGKYSLDQLMYKKRSV